MKRPPLVHILFFLLFLALCYFPLFLHLDHLSLRLWDEGRRAVNAFDMLQNGNWLVTHYAGEPEMWGTKPPFLIWCQAIFMKLLGYNELAVRLPAALAGLGTIFILILFSRRVLKKTMIGFFAGLVLLSTRGYISEHVTRSGDFDALLTFFLTGSLLCFFLMIRWNGNRKPPSPLKGEMPSSVVTSRVSRMSNGKREGSAAVKGLWNQHWLYLFTFFLILAALTKSIAAFFFLPGLLFYVLYKKQLLPLLKWKYTWLAISGLLLVVGGFYLLREIYNPGYLQAVWENELGGRYLDSKEGHRHPWYFYFKLMYKERFLPWLFLVPLGIFAGLYQNKQSRTLSAFTVFILFNLVFFFLVLIGGQTRVVWYMAPAYPLLALLVGIGMERLYQGACNYIDIKNLNYKYLFLSLFVIALFIQPYQKTIERIYKEKHPPWDLKFLKFKDFMERNQDIKTYKIVHRHFNSHIQFYRSVYNLKDFNITAQELEDFEMNKYEFGAGPLEFEVGDTIMVCEKKVYPKLDAVYEYEVLNQWDTCKLLVIK